jgi:hypothetical protein
MRGIPDFNFPAFDDATARLRELSHEVFSPAERDRKHYGDTVNDSATGDLNDIKVKFNLRETLLADLTFITTYADAIVVLPGWENSKGATAEVATARAINLPEHPCRVLTLEEALAEGPA